MKRIEAIAAVAENAGDADALIVCNIGFPSRELYAVKDRPENFYMLGSMGLASSIGLGIAMVQPDRKVIVIDGDGAVLMNLGTLATVANFAPKNYLLLILDNCCYGSTGSQPTCTHLGTDLAGMAKDAGAKYARTVADLDSLRQALRDSGNGLIVIKVEPGNADVPIIDLSPDEIMHRFRRSFLQAERS